MVTWARIGLRRGKRDAGRVAVASTESTAASALAAPVRDPKPDAALAKRPEAAAKADDLDALKKAVDDAASVGGGLWFSYLFVLFYLAVAAGAVTHADLFFEKPVKLPFLNIELPLLAFFALAPFLFLIVHTYTLLHLVMLSEKAKRYNEALYKQLGEAAAVSEQDKTERKAIRDGLRGQLPSNVFVQFLAGPPKMRDGSFGIALRGVAWLTLVVGPVLLLLLLQLQFLPYHSWPITWAHRVSLLLDLGLIWWLWRKIFSWGEGDAERWWATWNWSMTGVAVSLIAVLFSVAIATYRSEGLAAWITSYDKANWVGSVHDAIFESHFDPVSGRRWLPFSDALVLSNVIALDELGIDDPKKVEWRDFIFRAAGRRLEGAILDRANIARIDFSDAYLEGASFDNTRLDRASLNGADVQGASLKGARLEGASLNGALFHGASLEDARLKGASLEGAQLRGVPLSNAELQGASLDYAELLGASLNGSQLQGATLRYAELQGASLEGAHLQGASLLSSYLQGASLGFAELQGASLEGAHFQGASLFSAYLQGASLGNAELQGASLEGAQLQGTSLQSTTVEATYLDRAFLWRTKLTPSASAKPSLSESGVNWGPFSASGFDSRQAPWDQAAYESLHKQMEALPAGRLRDDALDRIRTLDCFDLALQTCEPPGAWVPPLQPSKELVERRNALLNAAVPLGDFRKALAESLRTLVCPGDQQTIYVVRGGGFQDRLEAAGPEAKSLLDNLLDKSAKNCAVAAKLSDADRSYLSKLMAKINASTKPPPT